MPHKLRVQYSGAVNPVVGRGDRREDVFLDDVARHGFSKTLAEAWQKTVWPVQTCCLKRNHYHLVLETPSPQSHRGARPLGNLKEPIPICTNGCEPTRNIKYLMFSKDKPCYLDSISISDFYQIKEEGDYSLTVFPIIYEFETNGCYADRINLPGVSTEMHLRP